MLTLDQIRQLETKVAKAIQLIQSLKEENDSLKLEVHDRQKRIEELENIVLVFKNDQAKIEEGILNALDHLSAFEDSVYQTEDTTASVSHAAGESSDSTHSNTSQGNSDAEASSPAASTTATQSADSENANANQMEIF